MDSSKPLIKLTNKINAHKCAIWSLAWVPHPTESNKEILFTGSSDGEIKQWNLTTEGDDNDKDNDLFEEEADLSNIKVTHQYKTNMRDTYSPITCLKCVAIPNIQNGKEYVSSHYLLASVSLDNIIKVYKINIDVAMQPRANNSTRSNSSKNGADDAYDSDEWDLEDISDGLKKKRRHNGITLDSEYDMNVPQRCIQMQPDKESGGTRNIIKESHHAGGIWCCDINHDASILATGDQFGQIFLFPRKSSKSHGMDSNNNNSSSSSSNSSNRSDEKSEDLLPHMVLSNVATVRVSKQGPAQTQPSLHCMPLAMEFNRYRKPEWLAVSCTNNQYIEIIDCNKFESVCKLRGFCCNIRDISWYHYDNYLCGACDDNNVYIFDPAEAAKKMPQCKDLLAKHRRHALEFKRAKEQKTRIEQKLGANCDEAKELTKKCSELFKLLKNKDQLANIRKFYVDVGTRALAQSLKGHMSIVTSVDFGNMQYIASVSKDRSLKLWDLAADKRLLETRKDHSDEIWKVRFNDAKKKFATVGDDGCLCVYAMAAVQQRESVSVPLDDSGDTKMKDDDI